MKLNTRPFLSTICLVSLLSISSAAQHKHTDQKKTGTSGMDMNMATMMQSPHHELMMAYMKSMSAFASALHEQSMKSEGLDVEAARASVSELRHNLDAMEALHQKHMQSMSSEMQSKMQAMMEKMDKDRSMLKDEVSALETDMQAEKPNAGQVTAHADALLKHLEMMSKMHAGSAAPKKKM